MVRKLLFGGLHGLHEMRMYTQIFFAMCGKVAKGLLNDIAKMLSGMSYNNTEKDWWLSKLSEFGRYVERDFTYIDTVQRYI